MQVLSRNEQVYMSAVFKLLIHFLDVRRAKFQTYHSLLLTFQKQFKDLFAVIYNTMNFQGFKFKAGMGKPSNVKTRGG